MTVDGKQDMAVAAAKALPPVSVTVAHTIFGISLNEWVSIITILYVALQIGHLIYKWVKGRADDKVPAIPT